jgi:hypothetical protein
MRLDAIHFGSLDLSNQIFVTLDQWKMCRIPKILHMKCSLEVTPDQDTSVSPRYLSLTKIDLASEQGTSHCPMWS